MANNVTVSVLFDPRGYCRWRCIEILNVYFSLVCHWLITFTSVGYVSMVSTVHISFVANNLFNSICLLRKTYIHVYSKLT